MAYQKIVSKIDISVIDIYFACYKIAIIYDIKVALKMLKIVPIPKLLIGKIKYYKYNCKTFLF